MHEKKAYTLAGVLIASVCMMSIIGALLQVFIFFSKLNHLGDQQRDFFHDVLIADSVIKNMFFEGAALKAGNNEVIIRTGRVFQKVHLQHKGENVILRIQNLSNHGEKILLKDLNPESIFSSSSDEAILTVKKNNQVFQMSYSLLPEYLKNLAFKRIS